MAITAAVVVIVLLTTSAIAIANYWTAEQRRLASVSRQLAITSKDAAGPDRALLIGARAFLVDDTPEARAALLEKLQEFRFLRRVVAIDSYIDAAGLAPGGDFLLGTDSGLRRLPRDGTAATPVYGSQGASVEAVTAVIAAEAGLLLGREDGRVDAVAEASARILIKAAGDVPVGREKRVRCLAYEPSKRLVAAGTGSGRIAIVRLSDGLTLKNFDEGDDVRINSVAFNPKHSQLAIGTSAGTVAIVDIDSLRIVARYPHVEGGVLSLGYLTDGSLVVVSSQGELLYFDARNSKLEKPSRGDIVPLATAAAIDSATSRVAIGDASGTVRLYDAATQRETGAEALRGHSDMVTAIVFGSDRDDLVSTSANGTVAVWDLAGRQGPAEELPQLNPSPAAIRTDATGAILAVLSDENRTELRRLDGKQWKLVVDVIAASKQADTVGAFFRKAERDSGGFEEIVSSIPGIAINDDSTRIAWTTSGGAILTLAIDNPGVAPMIVSAPGRGVPEDIVLSGDGKTIAAIEATGARISIYHLEGARFMKFSIVPPSAARSTTLDRTGDRIAIGMKDGSLAQYVWSNESWKLVQAPWPVHTSEVGGVMYSRDGQVIVSYGSGGGGADHTVGISNAIDAPDPRLLQARQAAGSVSSMSIGASAGLLAIGDHDGRVLTWFGPDVRFSGSLQAGTSEVPALFVDETGQRLFTSSGDGTFLSWSLNPAQWISLACAKANRSLRVDEWRELLPDDRYVASCARKESERTRQ